MTRLTNNEMLKIYRQLISHFSERDNYANAIEKAYNFLNEYYGDIFNRS